MPNLKEVRNRIQSVNATRQITSAMKLVSAAKLRRAQDAVTQMRPYADKLKEILANLSQDAEGVESPFMKSRTVNKVLLVVISSNRGLCGAFNTNVIRNVTRLLNEQYAQQHAQGEVYVITVGKKATSWASKMKLPSLGVYDEIFNNLTFSAAETVVTEIMEGYISASFDKVVLVYNEFVTAASQVINCEDFLPVSAESDGAEVSVSSTEYIFEPDQKQIIAHLIPMTLKTRLFKALLDSNAAEHGARMTAMHKATDNAGELIKSLKLSYNKARQAAITNEILEIVGGAEALKG
jgi:F-type H+-transporting ATPase subunit gamma